MGEILSLATEPDLDTNDTQGNDANDLDVSVIAQTIAAELDTLTALPPPNVSSFMDSPLNRPLFPASIKSVPMLLEELKTEEDVFAALQHKAYRSEVADPLRKRPVSLPTQDRLGGRPRSWFGGKASGVNTPAAGSGTNTPAVVITTGATSAYGASGGSAAQSRAVSPNAGRSGAGTTSREQLSRTTSTAPLVEQSNSSHVGGDVV